jgi:hypothetical protein
MIQFFAQIAKNSCMKSSFTKIFKVNIVIVFIILTGYKVSGQVIFNEDLRSGSAPAGWASSDDDFKTTADGYARLSGNGSGVLTTPTFNSSANNEVRVVFKVAKFSTGTDGPVSVEYSLNGGVSWQYAGSSEIPTGTTYVDGDITICANSPTMRIRFITYKSPSDKRLRDVVITGVGTGDNEVNNTILGEFNFTGSSATPSNVATGLNVSNIGLSAGSVNFGSVNPTEWFGSGTPYGQGNGGWTADNSGTAKNFNFDINIDDADEFDFTGITLYFRATGAGPSAITVFANDVNLGTLNVPDSRTLPFHYCGEINDLTSLNIKIAGWRNGSRTTTGGGQFRIDDIIVHGRVRSSGALPPSVGLFSIENITAFGLSAQAEVINDGGSAVTNRGFVISETSNSSNPELSTPNVTIITSGTGIGSFSESVTGLTQETEYAIRAFAVNDEGESYTDAITFFTLPALGATSYTQNFSNFNSTGTIPPGWSVSNDAYGGNWGGGSGAGLRGNNNVLGFLHTGATGIFTVSLSLNNNTGGIINALEIQYFGRANLLANTRFPEWTVELNGNPVQVLNFSTGEPDNTEKIAVLTGLNIPNGDSFTISWSSDRGFNAGGGSRQIGISDVSVTALAEPINYFLTNTDITNELSWRRNTDGTGGVPAFFDQREQIFNVTADATLSQDFTISGDNSKIVFGDGSTVNIEVSGEINADVEIEDNATVDFKTSALPTITDLSTSSTLIFDFGGTFTIPNFDYGSLVLRGGTKNFPNSHIAVNGNLTFDNTTLTSVNDDRRWEVSGNITLLNTVNYSGETRARLRTIGNNDQTITTNGNRFEVYNFQSTKTAGSLSFSSGAEIEAKNNLQLNFSGSSNFTDNESLLIYGDDLELSGEPSAYNLTGTLRLNALSGENDIDAYDDIPLNNFEVISDATATTRFGNYDLIINGNLSFDGEMVFTHRTGIELAGNLILNNTVDFSGDERPNFNITGGNAQTIDLGNNNLEAFNFYINSKSGGSATITGTGDIIARNNLRLNFPQRSKL